MTQTRYTKSHEWISLDGDIATIGITEYAQSQLGDVVYVEMPEPGRSLDAGGEAAVVESVKTASEIYAPVAGTVTEVNPSLGDDPALVNREAEAGGWFFRLRVADPAALGELLDRAAYEALVGEGH